MNQLDAIRQITVAVADPVRLEQLMRPRCDQTAAWTALQKLFEVSGKAFDLRAAFASDPQRFANFSYSAPYVFADLSKKSD